MAADDSTQEPVQDPTRSPPPNELVEVARDLVEVTGRWFPGRPGEDAPRHFLLASGFLARCRALLSGMATLVSEAEHDCVGALYRPLLETYLSGVYALLGNGAAADVLEAALKHQVHQIDVALGAATPEDRPDDAKSLPVSHHPSGEGLVERVDALFSSINPAYADWTPRAHDHHYRITSLYDAHGGIGCLHRYLDVDDEGAVVRPHRDTPTMAPYLLNMAISLVLGFAAVWAAQVGKELSPLVDLHDRWEALQPSS